jgi:hypothetical protein
MLYRQPLPGIHGPSFAWNDIMHAVITILGSLLSLTELLWVVAEYRQGAQQLEVREPGIRVWGAARSQYQSQPYLLPEKYSGGESIIQA